MSEQPLSNIDPRLQKQVQNARRAIDKGNPSYAIPICTDILKRFPGLYDVRKVLRDAQKLATGEGSAAKRFFAKVTSAPFALGGASKVKKDPKRVLETAEAMLTEDPTNVMAHKFLGQAAEELKYFNTAVFAYTGIEELEPENVENLKALANALIEIGQTQEAIKKCDSVIRIAPSDGDAQTIIRRASVAQSLEEGKWEEDNDFRDKLKDEEEAVQLEQASRSVTGKDAIESLIKSALTKAADEPGNINVMRDLANNYHKLGDFENAILWISKARETDAGGADVALEKLQQRFEIEQREAVIEERRQLLDGDPNNGELNASLQKAEQELVDFKFDQAKELVEKYPNEYGYRYDYGVLLLEKGELDQAIGQFQISQRNPKVRIESLVNLGKAFKTKRIFDLAAEQLNTANSEL